VHLGLSRAAPSALAEDDHDHDQQALHTASLKLHKPWLNQSMGAYSIPGSTFKPRGLSQAQGSPWCYMP